MESEAVFDEENGERKCWSPLQGAITVCECNHCVCHICIEMHERQVNCSSCKAFQGSITMQKNKLRQNV